MAKKLIVPVIADPSGFKHGLSESERYAKEFEGKIKGSASAVRSHFLLAAGGLVGAGSLVAGLKQSIDAAQELNVSTRALNAQLRANHENVKAVDAGLGGLNAKMMGLGFTSSQTEQAFTRLDRASGSAAAAQKYMGVTADFAAAKHIDLSQAALIVGKVMTGTTSALNRYGIAIPKGTSATEALAIAQQKLAGQAAAAVTPQAKFHAILVNVEATIGKVLLPTVDKYLTKLGDWFSKSDNQRKVTDAVKTALQGFSTILGLIVPLIEKGWHAAATFSDKMGGLRNSLIVLGSAFVAYKAGLIVVSIAQTAMGATGVGALTAIKGALISTGIGALFVGLGLAAGYVITHWSKVKAWFLEFWGWLKNVTRIALDEIKGYFFLWVANSIKLLKTLADGAASALGWLPGIGGKLKDAAKAVDGWYNDFKKRSSAAFADIGAVAAASFVAAYNKNLVGLSSGATGAGAGTGGLRATGTAAPSLSVQAGQGVFLDYLRKRGWQPDQIAQAQRLINYEDASGRPGDQNSSFGPRQLHVGGQLPAWVAARGPAFAQQWAWSQQGLTTAAAGIAGFGNLHGAALAQAIANKQGSSNIPKEYAAVLGGTPATFVSATTPGLPGDATAATAAEKKKAAEAAKAATAAFKSWKENYFTPLDNQYKSDLLISDEKVRLNKLEALHAKLAIDLKTASGKERQTLFNEEAKVQGKIQALHQKMAAAQKALLAKQHADYVKSLQDNLAAAQTSLARQQTLFDRGWSRIVNKITGAFNAATQTGLAAIQKQFGGPTPEEQARDAFQAQLDAAQRASETATAQTDLVTAQLSGDPAAVQAAQAHLGDVQNAQKLADLQTAADQSRTLANTETDKQMADYQAARDVQLENLNNWLDDQKTGLEAGTVTWAEFWQGAFSDAPSKYAPDAVAALQGIIDQQQRILDLQARIDGGASGGGSAGVAGGVSAGIGIPGATAVGSPVRRVVAGATYRGFASGGMVPGALGQPMLAVVHGGEQVLTPRQQSGGGNTYNISFPNYVGSRDELERWLASAFVRINRRGGLLVGDLR